MKAKHGAAGEGLEWSERGARVPSRQSIAIMHCGRAGGGVYKSDPTAMSLICLLPMRLAPLATVAASASKLDIIETVLRYTDSN
jgi:hypothetical protein